MNETARLVRLDLLSEFCMPPNSSYVRVAKRLIQARYWMVEHPPKDAEEAQALMVNECMDRERRMRSVLNLSVA